MVTLIEQSKSNLNVFVLDTCSNNSNKSNLHNNADSSKFLSPIKHKADGTLIAFATTTDKTAKNIICQNGLYTKTLVNHLNAPSAEPLRDIFNFTKADVYKISKSKYNGLQDPWTRDNIYSLDKLYFSTPKPSKGQLAECNHLLAINSYAGSDVNAWSI